MMKSKIRLIDYFTIFSFLIFLIYMVSIFVINIIGREWVNYDIYSDAILTKYIAMERDLFPEGWHFGNQVYVVATPVLGSFIYSILKDTYLSLSLASCIMTLLCVFFYVWSIKPFAKSKSIIISLLVLIGCTTIGTTAYGDLNGLQVFYTMASYYSCYIIGIFVTLGVCFRILKNIPVAKPVILIVVLLNFALGIQSLRELLVLNLPLFGMSLLALIICKLLRKDIINHKKNISFVFLTLIASVFGVFLEKWMVLNETINQQTILKEANDGLKENIKHSIKAFLEYIGFCIPKDKSDLFELCGALFLLSIISIAVFNIIYNFLKKKKITVLGFGIIFFSLSLFAVFCAGVFVLELRSIYYFCWYLLAAFSVCYLVEMECRKTKFIKYSILFCLLCVSILNYKLLFYSSFKNISNAQEYYQTIVSKMNDDGVEYLFSDWRTEKNAIGTASHDKIVYATLKFSNNPDDLWDTFDYLYYDAWFDENNFDKAYIVLSDEALEDLNSNFSKEYINEFMSNLEPVYEYDDNGHTLHFYSGSNKMFYDMIK